MHFMHNGIVDAKSRAAWVRDVRDRMDALGITQRELAAQLGISQGHLSKVLRGQFGRESRVTRAVRRILGASSSSENAEEDLLLAIRRLTGGSSRRLQKVMQIMHAIEGLHIADASRRRARR